MNRVSPEKLQDSKWTAVDPKDKEKHFVVTACPVDGSGKVDQIEMEAVYTRRRFQVHWRDLKDEMVWRIGWQ
jgi:tryptophan-rich hypothetical protein